MNEHKRVPTVDQPAMYVVRIVGRLDERTATWFEDLTVVTESTDDGTPVTQMAGVVADQAALHGVLARIRDLGLPLLSVQWIENRWLPAVTS